MGSSTQYFVSVASFNAAEGDVFKVIHDWTLVPAAAPFFHAVDLDVVGISTGINITDLKSVGEIDTLILLAGGDDGSGKPRVLLSTDGMGNVWANCTTPPTGGIWSDIAGVSLVLADDFATSGKAVAVTTGENSGVARTVDWGGIWNTVPLIDAEITIEFSQPMDKEVTSQALTIPGKIYRIDYEIIWDETGTSMKIKPIVIWQPYWDYEVIITDQARSEDGINLEEDYTFHFKT